MAEKAEKQVFVELSTKEEKARKRKFEIQQANKLLNLPKSQWKLADDKFTYNGTEIAKK